MSGESPPSRNLTSWFNKKFLQFAQSSVMNPSMCSPRHYRTHSSPTYSSPTRSQLGKTDEEFLIGCSVCGTKAIEETVFAENPQTSNGLEDPNSGAYARIVAYYEKPLENMMKSSTELKSVSISNIDAEYERPFEVAIESNPDSPVVKKIVYKEFSPPAKNPLTPLNYEQKHAVKDCFFNNPTAKNFVKEEERKIVVTRRAEYLQRTTGQVKTFVRTDTGQNKSKMISRVPSDMGSYYKGKSDGKKGKVSKNSKKGNYNIKVHTGEDSERGSSRLSSSSSQMVIHFQMPQDSLKSPKGSDVKMRSSPGSRSESPMNLSFTSNGSNKHLLTLPGQSRSRNQSPKPPSKNASKNPSRSRTPVNLNVPQKSASSSRSVSPVNSSKGSSKSPLNSAEKNFFFPDNKALKVPSSKNSNSGSSRGNSPRGAIKKGKNQVLRTQQNKKTPLPKLFEPRNLREFYYIQGIAAIMIQRAFRNARENRKKNNSGTQWQEEDSQFSQDDVLRAMKLIGKYAEYIEKTGKKLP